ncbi:hypothetical protein [Murinocardiopsis flavida]|nr:hypothetical protein [Murinocardiopsis flavida]
MLDLLLLGAVRAWSSRPGAGTPARADGDPVVGISPRQHRAR